MKKTERHQIILDEVHLHNRVLLSDLTRTLNVSMDTVRRDLMELDKLTKSDLNEIWDTAVLNTIKDKNPDAVKYIFLIFCQPFYWFLRIQRLPRLRVALMGLRL